MERLDLSLPAEGRTGETGFSGRGILAGALVKTLIISSAGKGSRL
jgi:hypothetical protein